MRNTLQSLRLLAPKSAILFFKRGRTLGVMFGMVAALCFSIGCEKEKESAQTTNVSNALPQTEKENRTSEVSKITLLQFSENRNEDFSWKHQENRVSAEANSGVPEQRSHQSQPLSLSGSTPEINSVYKGLFTIQRLPPVQFSSQSSPALRLPPLPTERNVVDSDGASNEGTGSLVLDMESRSTGPEEPTEPTEPKEPTDTPFVEEPKEKKLFSMFGPPSMPEVSQEETLAVENAEKLESPVPPTASFAVDSPSDLEVSLKTEGENTQGVNAPVPLPPIHSPDSKIAGGSASELPTPSDSMLPTLAQPETTQPSKTHSVLVQETNEPNSNRIGQEHRVIASRDTLNVVRTEAQRLVQHGFANANRGMIQSARECFLQALRVMAQAKDAVRGERGHRQALSEGMRAMKEAEDFQTILGSAELDLDLESITETHRTPVLEGIDLLDVSPIAAYERYLEYAVGKLGEAVEGEPAGSMALYGLAKIETYMAIKQPEDARPRKDRAITFFQSSLAAHPQNHLAANEAGVLLVQQGRLDQAEAMLQRTVKLSPSSLSFHNLAVLQQKKGELQLAQQNETHARRLAAQVNRPMAQQFAGVTWVAPQVFARGAIPPTNAMPQQGQPSGQQRVMVAQRAPINQQPYRTGPNGQRGNVPAQRMYNGANHSAWRTQNAPARRW